MKKRAKVLSDAEILAYLSARDAHVTASEGTDIPVKNSDTQGNVGHYSPEHIWALMEPLAKQRFPELESFDRARAEQHDGSKKPSETPLTPHAVRVADSAAAEPFAKQSLLRSIVAVAAVLLVTVALGVCYRGLPHHYHVVSGEQLSIRMNDGSTLLLHGGTDLTLAEGWGRRHVQLRHGYVFFRVAKNSSKPFTIDNGDSMVRVLGTSFSVYNTGRHLELAVESGRVSLADTRSGQPQYHFELIKNQKVIVDKTPSADAKLTRISEIDPDVEFSWRRGEVYFSEQSLEDIVQRMSNFYPQSIQVMDAGHRKITLSGNYSTTDFDAFLKALALAADLRVETGPNGNILIF